MAYEMIEKTISLEYNCLSVAALCELCNVSRSGFYSWKNSKDKRAQREADDESDFELILIAYNYRGYKKGARSIHMRLLRMGVLMNVKKIRRLMKKYGLFCPVRKANPYRRMAKALRTNAVADNLVKREFAEHGPRVILLTDITYIPLGGGFCYLSVIKDGCTKEALSYVLSQSLEVDFVLETVELLMKEYGFTLDDEVMIHSDQGAHYTSVAFRTLLRDCGIRQSMSRRGNCWDNAPQESFFGHMKEELREKSAQWKTFEDVSRDIDDWMDYYNNDRPQWDLGKLTPSEYYIYITTGNKPDFPGTNEQTGATTGI